MTYVSPNREKRLAAMKGIPMYIILAPSTSENYGSSSRVAKNVFKFDTALEVQTWVMGYSSDIARLEIYEVHPVKLQLGLETI